LVCGHDSSKTLVKQFGSSTALEKAGRHCLLTPRKREVLFGSPVVNPILRQERSSGLINHAEIQGHCWRALLFARPAVIRNSPDRLYSCRANEERHTIRRRQCSGCKKEIRGRRRGQRSERHALVLSRIIGIANMSPIKSMRDWRYLHPHGFHFFSGRQTLRMVILLHGQSDLDAAINENVWR
jgi:hypothetical protein